jgi:hypothetical protein
MHSDCCESTPLQWKSFDPRSRETPSKGSPAVKLFSSKQLADEIGINRTSVAKIAREKQIGQIVGNGYVFTEDEADQIRAAAHPTKGNPNWIAAKKQG